MEEPSGDDRDRSRSRSPQNQQREQDPDMASRPTSRYYLGGLGNKVINIKDISNYFSKIVSADITDVTVKHHKGMGYIEFDETSQYEEAKLLGTHEIKGRTVECKRAKAREQKQKPESTSEPKQEEGQGSNGENSAAAGDGGEDKSGGGGTNRFFIGGINSSVTQNHLLEYFKQYGSIVDVLLLFHKGFGYIEFTRLSEQQISNIIGTHHIRGRSLEVKKAKPKVPHSHTSDASSSSPQPPPPPVHQAVFDHHSHGRDGVIPEGYSPRYFLGGVTEQISHRDLKEYFSKFGDLVDITIIPNKGIGYIQFNHTSQAFESEREDKLFHQKHPIKGLLVNCSRANPKQGYSQDPKQQSGGRPYPQSAQPPPYHAKHEGQDGMDQHHPDGSGSPRRFFLGGVNPNTTRANLMEYFTKYGEVINLMIFEAKNYGYIEFKRTTQEHDVQRESVLIGDVGRSLHTINGSTITVKRAIPRNQKMYMQGPHSDGPMQSPVLPPMPMEEKPPQQDDSKIKMFVGGLGLLNEVQLREYFTPYGEIDSVLILRGFGFITFVMQGVVEKVVEGAKVINGKTMHCISGKYVECKRTFDKVHKFKPKPHQMLPHQQNQQFPGPPRGPTPPTWNNFNPEATPFTPNSMQHNQNQPPQQFGGQPQQQQQPGGFFNPQQGQQQGGMFPGGGGPQQMPGFYGGMMPPQQGFDMNNPGGVPQQGGGYDMNNMGQMMGQQQQQQGYDWNNAPQYVDWSGYMPQQQPQQGYDWANSSLTYAGQVNYFQGQAIQFPDFITGGTSGSSMNASEQGSMSLDNDNSSASTPTQDSQQTPSSSNAGEERTEEISDNTSSMSVQSVLSKYATEKPQTKSVQSVLSKYSVLPSTVEGDYSSSGHDSRDEDTAYGSDNNTTQYRHHSNVNGGQGGGEEEEEEEWFEGDLE